MAEKVNGTHPVDLNGKADDESAQADMQRCAYLSAIQSPRVTVLVGLTRAPFQVPQDLLIQHSPLLGAKCRSASSTEGKIELPEVNASTFEDFFIWLHVYEPRMGTKSFQAVLDLAILAETYHIYHLRNQTSDLLRREFSGEQRKLTPGIISVAYKSVPSGSTLRQLCASAFAISSLRSRSSPRQHEDYLEWKTAFETLPELGWDYFVEIQNAHSQPVSIMAGGECRFHDHSDILSWAHEQADKCPYPHGAPLIIPKSESSVVAAVEDAEEELPVQDAPVEEEARGATAPEEAKEDAPSEEAASALEAGPEQPAATSKNKKKKKKGKAAIENGTLVDGSSAPSV